MRSEGVNFWSFDFAHVEPAFHCLYEQAPTMHRLKSTTFLADSSSQPTPNREEGNGSIQNTKNWLPVFDFALRYEHLEDDMASLFGFLNARRPMDQPPLAELKQLPWEKKGTSISKSAASASSSSSSSSRSASFPAAAGGADVRKGATSSHAAADDADGGGGNGGGQQGSSGNRTGGRGDGNDESASSGTRKLAQPAGRSDGGRDDSAISSSNGHPHGTAIQDCMHAAHGNASSIHTLHAQRRMHVTSFNASAPAALFSHAEKYRACGAPCVCNIAKFASEDIRLLGWDVPHAD